MIIKIDHIAKIEGHAGFVADIAQGNIVKARLNVMEGARLLEGILRGRSLWEVSQISARICGVCPVVHILTSIKALEAALGVSVSSQTIALRKLLMAGQLLNSHALHLFFFSLSDFFGIKDDLKLIKKYPDRAKDALLIRDFGNQIVEIVGGRSIHPLTPEVGGFKKLPSPEKLKRLFERIQPALKAAKNLAKFFSHLKYPSFERDCQLASLVASNQYAIYDGQIKIEQKVRSPEKFMPQINEFQLTGNGAKRSRFKKDLFMVGALARITNNAEFLHSEAKSIIKGLNFKIPSGNPFYNILAQAIELVHCVEEAQDLLEKLSKTDLSHSSSKVEIKAGKGFGAIEAPRGILFYYYEVDKDGFILNSNIITPTSQNLARLEEDLSLYLPQLMKQTKAKCQEDCQDSIKMLVRAYDPCLTCATH